MKTLVKLSASLLTTLLTLLVALSIATPTKSFAAGKSKGGGGGGGGSTVSEARVTGYVTAIDYANSTLSIGASYYGSGALHITSATKISLDNLNCSLEQLQLGDWVEARYVYSNATKLATKLSASSR